LGRKVNQHIHMNTIQYDAQADSINVEDIATNVNNRIVLSRIKRNCEGDSEVLYIQNEQEIDLDAGETGEDCIDYVPEGAKDMGWLGYFIGKNNHLKELYFRFVEGMSIDIIKPFIMGLNNNKSITSLDFNRWTLLGGEIFTMLGPFFENNKNLTNLVINECTLGDDGWRLLALAIGSSSSKSLRQVYLTGCNISDEGSVDIITSLSMHPKLQEFHLNGNRIRTNGCMVLATLLQHSCTELQTLDLDDNGINNEAIDALVPALKNCSLNLLRLSGNTSVTSRGWQRLATILEAPNSNLRDLSLIGNNIDDEALVAFADALKNNRSFKTLSLGALTSASIGEEAKRAFSKLVCDKSSINSTFLSNHTLRYVTQLQPYFKLNSIDDKKKVAMIKILQHHDDFDMIPYFEWEFKVLPLMIGWFQRASTIEMPRRGFEPNIGPRKLSTIYQFVRGMPLLYVETRLRQELEEIKLAQAQMEERQGIKF